MKRVLLTLAAFLFFSLPAPARQPVPLLPPRAVDDTATPDSVGTAVPSPAEKPQSIGLGIELGLTGRTVDSGADALGMQRFWGGRIVARAPLFSNDLFLKPSIGYFRNAQGGGSTGVTQHVFEGGLGVHYSLLKSSRVRWLIGVSNRVDAQISTISAPGTSSTSSPVDWRYRLGPATGLALGLNRYSSLTFDFEYTFPVTQSPVRPVAALTAGLLFFLY